MSSKEIKVWANIVLTQLKDNVDLTKDEFIFLAGNNYRKFLIPEMKNYKVPMQNLGIGRQLKFLKDNTQ